MQKLPRILFVASTPTPAPAKAAAESTPVPSESPAASPAATAAASATPVAPVALPPGAPPQILDMQLDKTVVHGGDTVSGNIVTSSNVASVEARIANFSIAVPKIGAGRFALSYTIPDVPFFLKKTYALTVIARNTAGDQTTRSVPITIR